MRSAAHPGPTFKRPTNGTTQNARRAGARAARMLARVSRVARIDEASSTGTNEDVERGLRYVQIHLVGSTVSMWAPLKKLIGRSRSRHRAQRGGHAEHGLG